MNQKIIDIAKIVFALIFVVLLAVMMGTISSKGNAANTQLVDTLEMSGGLSLDSYNNTYIKGGAVENALKNGKSVGGETKLFYIVITGADEDGTIYGYGASSGDTKFSNMTYADDGKSVTTTVYPSKTFNSYTANSGADTYINNTSEFHARLIENKNGVTVGIEFTQQ